VAGPKSPEYLAARIDAFVSEWVAQAGSGNLARLFKHAQIEAEADKVCRNLTTVVGAPCQMSSTFWLGCNLVV
jgi:hypothetical protein